MVLALAPVESIVEGTHDFWVEEGQEKFEKLVPYKFFLLSGIAFDGMFMNNFSRFVLFASF